MWDDDEELVAARRQAMTAILDEIVRRIRTGETMSGPPLPVLTLAEAYAWLHSPDQPHGGRMQPMRPGG